MKCFRRRAFGMANEFAVLYHNVNFLFNPRLHYTVSDHALDRPSMLLLCQYVAGRLWVKFILSRLDDV